MKGPDPSVRREWRWRQRRGVGGQGRGWHRRGREGARERVGRRGEDFQGLSGEGCSVRKAGECEGSAGAGTMERRAGWRGCGGKQWGRGTGAAAEPGRRAGEGLRADVTEERDSGRHWGVMK
jgi:hypothetical protein